MEHVQPIRKKSDIEAMKRLLRKQSLRNHALFVLGINSGLRISDILALKTGDVVREQYGRTRIAERVSLREEKTNKVKDFVLNTTVRSALGEYLRRASLDLEDPLFPSRKAAGGKKPISRVQAYRIIRQAAERVGIDERIGTHTLRKTFGYHAYKSGVDILVIQDIFNHESQAVTLRYIGIKREDKDSVYRGMKL